MMKGVILISKRELALYTIIFILLRIIITLLAKELIALCRDGGSLSLKELITKYNMYNPFNEEDIRSLSIFIEKRIKELTKD